jgi:hypothetical protein
MTAGRNAKLKPGNKVILTEIPPGLLDGLPEEDQLDIKEIVGKPIRFNEYDKGDMERAELEFRDRAGHLHFIFVGLKFIQPAKSSKAPTKLPRTKKKK